MVTSGGVASALSGKMSVNPQFIELYGNTPFIDFHYNNSTADYTTRLIETSSGVLSLYGKLRIGASNLAPFSTSSHTATVTAAAGSYGEASVAITKANYYPLGVVGISVANISGGSGLYPARFWITDAAVGSGTLKLLIRNANTSGTVSNATIYVYVFWTSMI